MSVEVDCNVFYMFSDLDDLFYCELFVVWFCVCGLEEEEVFMFIFVNFYVDLDEVE